MNCHACKAHLEYVFPDAENRNRSEQFDNALPITFDGGYGMFHDDFENDCQHHVIICHECAHSLCDAVPWIKELINPHASHSHRTDYKEQHPDHYGWDYK